MTDTQAPGLTAAVRDWGTEQFERTLKSDIEALDGGCLPLYQGTQAGGRVDDSDLSVTVISSRARGSVIESCIGVFFTEVVGGCSCGDEPFTQPGYCELRVTIDRHTARAGFELIDDGMQGLQQQPGGVK